MGNKCSSVFSMSTVKRSPHTLALQDFQRCWNEYSVEADDKKVMPTARAMDFMKQTSQALAGCTWDPDKAQQLINDLSPYHKASLTEHEFAHLVNKASSSCFSGRLQRSRSMRHVHTCIRLTSQPNYTIQVQALSCCWGPTIFVRPSSLNFQYA